jgi:tetratricopeptide (TPR) repeat protein
MLVSAVLMEFSGNDRFIVRRRLGQGGMGIVYEAADSERGGVVALKTLHNLDPRALYRFKAEFRTLADVAHPNLVRLGELFGDGNVWFFTMELVEGHDFMSWVRGGAWPETPTDADSEVLTAPRLLPRGPTAPVALAPRSPSAEPPPPADERRLRAALRQLAQGIAALHAVQKVHRDIKPSNVMVTRAGRVVLLDFGLATDAGQDDRLESGATVVGTAPYMSPEQAQSGAVGPESDWYALGSMMYEALTGRLPFAGEALAVMIKKQQYEPPPPRTLVPDVPRDLDALCADLLRRDPRDRPPAHEILERLGAAPPPPELVARASVHEAPVFVGRGVELEALAAAFAETERSLPISMFVLGESGMGKSALVRRFLDGVEERKPRPVVLAGRCYERESVPFKAFDDVVDALAAHLAREDELEVARMVPRDAGTLARVFPVLRRVAAIGRAIEQRVPDPQELRQRAFVALRALLVALARRRRVVLFVDDFQWADADSLALFSTVMHGLEAPPLLFVATVRASPEEVAAGKLPAVLGSIGSVPGDLRTIGVHGLPPDDAWGLAQQLLGRGSEREIRDIIDEAGGHPLFIQELARHLAGEIGTQRDVRLDDALWARIGLVEPAARRMLEVLAIAGEPLPQPVARQAAGLDTGELGRVVGVLRVASLARSGGRGGDNIECYHDRVREAVVARLDADTTRRHHEGLANALEAAAGPSHDGQALVRHLEAAGLVERAATQAVRAARAAAEALAFERAASMYSVALRVGDLPAHEARVLRIELADALVNAGRGTDAADTYLAAADGADAAVRLECRRKAAGHLLITGDIERGLATLQDVLGELGARLPPTPRRALLSFLWHRAGLRLRGTRFRPRDESALTRRELELIDLYHSVGVGLSLVDTIRGADFQARGLRLALDAGEVRRVVRGIALDAGILASQGARSNARAMKRLDRCAEIAAELQDPYLEGWVIGGRGLAHYLGGRFTQGAEMLKEAEAPLRADTRGNIWEFNTVRVFRLFALRQLGRWREMRDELSEHLRDAARRGDRYAETSLARGVNMAWLIAGDPARARRELEDARWTPPEGGYHMQHWYELRARLELGLYENDVETVARLLAEGFAPVERSLLTRAQTLRTEVMWLRGRCALAVYGSGGAGRGDLLDLAARSVRQLRGEKMPYTLAWAALLDAGLHDRRGDAAGARVQLEQAAQLGTAADLRMVTAVARMALGDVRGDDAITAEGVVAPLRMAATLAPGLGF